MNPLRSLRSARALLEEGRASPADLLQEAIDRNRWLDGGPEPIHAFLRTVADRAEGDGGWAERGAGSAAAEADAPRPTEQTRTSPRVGPLSGVPFAVKDNICTARFPTTCGSRLLEGFRSPYAATAVRRLEAAGARIFGTTNLDEFAMGSSTENSAFGPTRNPVDRSRVPGGSSGGSAAAVAAGVVPVALGSSTGGSVRQPASFCGVVGVKPTYGRVSRYGLVAFASSLDHVGVLARDVGDAATVLEAISGFDPRDATSQPRPPPRAAALGEVELDGAVLGVPREYTARVVDPAVGALLEETLERASRAGAVIREVSLSDVEVALSCYYVLAPAEASSNLARFDGVRYGRRVTDGGDLRAMIARTRGERLGPEVKRRIMLGTYVLSAGYREAYYLRGQGLRSAIAADFGRLFEDGVDALLAPTTPAPAFRLRERMSDPYEMYASDIFTVSANLAGLPAVSFPIGNAGRLPVGVQLICAAWQEERMLGLAQRLEEAVGYVHPLERRAVG